MGKALRYVRASGVPVHSGAGYSAVARKLAIGAIMLALAYLTCSSIWLGLVHMEGDADIPLVFDATRWHGDRDTATAITLDSSGLLIGLSTAQAVELLGKPDNPIQLETQEFDFRDSAAWIEYKLAHHYGSDGTLRVLIRDGVVVDTVLEVWKP